MKYPKLNTFRPAGLEGAISPMYLLATTLAPPFLCYALHTGLVFFAALSLADRWAVVPGGFINPFATTSVPLVEVFLRWDAHWYLYIAQWGYTPQSIVFFPALPAMIHLLTKVSNMSYPTAGFVLCNLFAFTSFCALYAVARLDYSEAVARQALWAYGLYPVSFYLNSIYTEPLFLTFSLSAVFFARKRLWLSAGIFTAMTCLTRNLGIILWLFLAWEIYRQWPRRSGMLAQASALSLAPLALVGFLAVNVHVSGDWLAFVHAQVGWGRVFCLPLDNLYNALHMLWLTLPSPEPALVLDLSLVIVSLVVLTQLTFSRKYHIYRPYLFLGWSWLLIPLCSTAPWLPLYSLSRFTLVLFPLFLYTAQLPFARYRAGLIIGSVVLIVYTALFASWHWVS